MSFNDKNKNKSKRRSSRLTQSQYTTPSRIKQRSISLPAKSKQTNTSKKHKLSPIKHKPIKPSTKKIQSHVNIIKSSHLIQEYINTNENKIEILCSNISQWHWNKVYCFMNYIFSNPLQINNITLSDDLSTFNITNIHGQWYEEFLNINNNHLMNLYCASTKLAVLIIKTSVSNPNANNNSKMEMDDSDGDGEDINLFDKDINLMMNILEEMIDNDMDSFINVKLECKERTDINITLRHRITEDFEHLVIGAADGKDGSSAGTGTGSSKSIKSNVIYETNYVYFILLFIIALIFTVHVIFFYSLSYNIYAMDIEINWRKLLFKGECKLSTMILFKIVLYFYQSLDQILSRKGLNPSSQFESFIVSS